MLIINYSITVNMLKQDYYFSNIYNFLFNDFNINASCLETKNDSGLIEILLLWLRTPSCVPIVCLKRAASIGNAIHHRCACNRGAGISLGRGATRRNNRDRRTRLLLPGGKEKLPTVFLEKRRWHASARM